jgi:hypothetical protein
MPVFDGVTKIKRRVPDPLTDKKLCPVGQLQFPIINTIIALVFPGIDITIVHGDQWIQIDGSVTCNISVNYNLTIFQNHIHVVMQNYMRTVIQNFINTVIGIQVFTQIGMLINVNVTGIMRTNVGITVYVFVSPTQRAHSSPEFHCEPFKFTCIGLSIALTGVKIEATGMALSVVPLKMEMKAMSLTLASIDMAIKVMDMKLAGLNAGLYGVNFTVSYLAMKTATLELSIPMFKICGIQFGPNQVI